MTTNPQKQTIQMSIEEYDQIREGLSDEELLMLANLVIRQTEVQVVFKDTARTRRLLKTGPVRG